MRPSVRTPESRTGKGRRSCMRQMNIEGYQVHRQNPMKIDVVHSSRYSSLPPQDRKGAVEWALAMKAKGKLV